MKVHRVISRTAILTGIFAVFAIASLAQTGSPANWSPSLNPETFLKSETINKNAPQSILLIGENHASVKSQQDLAELLEKLHQTHQFDTILMEGSNGPIDAGSVRAALLTIGPKGTPEFLKGQLGVGRIAAYEYMALMYPDVKVFGVEDMDAKRRYTVGAEGRLILEGLQETIDMHRGALALAQEASRTLEVKALERSNAPAELKNYSAKIEDFTAQVAGNGAHYAHELETLTDHEEQLKNIYRKAGQLLSGYIQLHEDSLAFERLFKKGQETGATRTDVLTFKARLEREYAKFEMDSRRAGYKDGKTAAEELNKYFALFDKQLEAEQRIEKISAGFTPLERSLQGQFFMVANALRSANAGKPVPALQSFLRDEQQREKAKAAKEDPYLAERNQYMLRNTLAYLHANPAVKNVVMVVGLYHLEEMTNLLRPQNVNVLAGKLAAATLEIEPWENRAWELRDRPAEQVFSIGSNNRVSPLLDKGFRTEFPALFARLQSVGPGGKNGFSFGNTRVFELGAGATKTKSIVVTSDFKNLQADWGSYLVGWGKLPDNTGSYYLIFDRGRLGRIAAKNTTSAEWFVPAFATRTAQGAMTKFRLPTGAELDVTEFLTHVPSTDAKIPQRIVLASEGDAKPIHTALAGDGQGPPPWTAAAVRFAEPPERRGPFVFFTKNIERARKNLDIVNKAEPLPANQIASFELGVANAPEGNLDNLWFTPERGDHARVFLIAGENTVEFRNQLKAAAEAGLLRNKQIALATCFDAKETDALREMLLDSGATMVWTPESRISPQAARKLRSYLERVDAAYDRPPAKAMDDSLDRALEIWYRESPDDPDIDQLLNGSRWVELYPLPLGAPAPSTNSQQANSPETVNGL